MSYRCGFVVGVAVVLALPELSWAQPSRQLPGTRPFLAGMMQGSPPANQPPRNSRTRPAASQFGLESTDFYPKNGYPKVLGDAVELGAANAGAGGMTNMGNTGGQAGNNGNQGVQASGSGGFQGNTGNQIGQQGGGTIFGGIFGFSPNNGNPGLNNSRNNGVTGGGFTGMVPKGFGFGGTFDR